MLRKIKLYGKLAKFVGHRVLEADVHNAAEAVKFLVANWPALEQHMAKQYYKVDVGSSALVLDEIAYPIGSEDISITPVIAGAGNVGRIVLGAALITAAVMTGGGLSVLSAPVFSTSAAGATVFGGWSVVAGKVGMLLVLSGVAGLLTPVPKPPDSEEDPQNSFSFSGIQQTSTAGTAVPVCYGEILTGSVVISAEIDVSEQET